MDMGMALMLWNFVSHSLRSMVTGHLLSIFSKGTLGDRSDICTIERPYQKKDMCVPAGDKSHRQRDKEAYEAHMAKRKLEAGHKLSMNTTTTPRLKLTASPSPAAILKAKVRAAAKK